MRRAPCPPFRCAGWTTTMGPWRRIPAFLFLFVLPAVVAIAKNKTSGSSHLEFGQHGFLGRSSDPSAHEFADAVSQRLHENPSDQPAIVAAIVTLLKFQRNAEKECGAVVEAHCSESNASYMEGPCDSNIYLYPFGACWKKQCVITSAAPFLSEECKVALMILSLHGAFLLRLQEGEGIVIANLNLFALFAEEALDLPLLILSFAALVLCFMAARKGWKGEMQRKALYECVLRTIVSDPNLRQTVEGLTDHSVDADPIRQYYFDLGSKVHELRRQKNQFRAIRAIYSLPTLVSRVEENMDQKMGHLPPMSVADIVRLYQPEEKRPWAAIVESIVPLLLLSFSYDEEIMPPWFSILYRIIYLSYNLYKGIRSLCSDRHFSGARICSYCCQCKRSSSDATATTESKSGGEGGKERNGSDNDDKHLMLRCSCCNDTGVCTLDCEECSKRLEKKFGLLNRNFVPRAPDDDRAASVGPGGLHVGRRLI